MIEITILSIIFCKFNKIVFQAAAPAQSQARVEARNHNAFYGSTIITTPNNITNREDDEGTWCFTKILGDACRFDEAYYDWSRQDILELLAKKSSNDYFYIEFSYKQLGRDDKWYEENCRALNNDLLKIKREILLEWTKASDVSVFSEEQLEAIFKHVKEPIAKITINKFWNIDLYTTDIDYNKPYMISCDCATGSSQDASAITIFDPVTFEIVGDFRDNHIDTEDFKELLIKLVGFYFKNSILAIENNSIGNPIITALMRSPVAKNLYYEYREIQGQKIEKAKKVVTHTSTKEKVQKFGINTNSNSKNSGSRDYMIEILNTTVNNQPEILNTPNLYSDIKGLERDKTGKVQHSVGGHDDSLFSYLIGRYCLAFGTNLARFQLPVKGKDPLNRKRSMIRMNKNLQEANTNKRRANATMAYGYNGLANDMIEEASYFELRKKIDSGGKIGLYSKITNQDLLQKFDRFQSKGNDF